MSLIKRIVMSFMPENKKAKRIEWYNSIVLPVYDGPYKFTKDRPIGLQPLWHYVTFNESYLLLEKYGYVKPVEVKSSPGQQAYYVADKFKTERMIEGLIAEGKIKLPVGYEGYVIGFNVDG